MKDKKGKAPIIKWNICFRHINEVIIIADVVWRKNCCSKKWSGFRSVLILIDFYSIASFT